MDTLEVGKTYTAFGQGTCITPQTRCVKVIWFDDRDVHYQLDGTGPVLQTPRDRFIEVISQK